jgi:general secretion pathway protein K
VLWLTAALSAIAFSVAGTVRGETERTSTEADATRAYYLASGSIDRAILWILWGAQDYRNPDDSPRFYRAPMPYLVFPYASGEAVVEVIPETGKLNVNTATPEDLYQVMVAAGADPDRARQIAANIVESRTPGPPAQLVPLSPNPPSSFPLRHASFEELEDLLLVPGMTPELFYGHYDRDSSGRLIPRGGLRDCLTVFGMGDRVDANTAPPALLEALGIPADAVARMIARRLEKPFKSLEEVAPFAQGAPGAGRLAIGGNTIWSLRATARLRLSSGKFGDLRRSVSAVVKFLDPVKWDPPYHILRWYDDAWSPTGSGS